MVGAAGVAGAGEPPLRRDGVHGQPQPGGRPRQPRHDHHRHRGRHQRALPRRHGAARQDCKMSMILIVLGYIYLYLSRGVPSSRLRSGRLQPEVAGLR